MTHTGLDSGIGELGKRPEKCPSVNKRLGTGSYELAIEKSASTDVYILCSLRVDSGQLSVSFDHYPYSWVKLCGGGDRMPIVGSRLDVEAKHQLLHICRLNHIFDSKTTIECLEN